MLNQALENCEIEFQKMNERFENYYERATSFTPDLSNWKKEVTCLVNTFADNSQDIKAAFRLIEANRKKNLIQTGEKFKGTINDACSSIEPFLSETLKDIKVEKRVSFNLMDLVSVQYPKLEMESLIFNTNINGSCLESVCVGDANSMLNVQPRKASITDIRIPVLNEQMSSKKLLHNDASQNMLVKDAHNNSGYLKTPNNGSKKLPNLISCISINNISATPPRQFIIPNINERDRVTENGPRTTNLKTQDKKPVIPILNLHPTSLRYTTNPSSPNHSFQKQTFAENFGFLKHHRTTEDVKPSDNKSEHLGRNKSKKDGLESFLRDTIHPISKGLDSDIFKQNDNLLHETIKDLPSLASPQALSKARTELLEAIQHTPTRAIAHNLAKSSNASPRGLISSFSNKALHHQPKFAPVEVKQAPKCKPFEEVQKLKANNFMSNRVDRQAPRMVSPIKSTHNIKLGTPSHSPNNMRAKEIVVPDSQKAKILYNNSLTNRSVEKKSQDLEKLKALKQIQSGSIGEQLKDLKANRLMAMDLSNSSCLIRP